MSLPRLKSQEKNYFKSCPFHQDCDFSRIHNNKLPDKIEFCEYNRSMKFYLQTICFTGPRPKSQSN